ncbi:MAG: cation transporter [Clostridia bacterium]|nr:cation transporter [Clostridia bacterium]
MKTERNILIAFILNFVFSVFELIGGIFTGSVAIISDAIHDFGDAFSIGISFFLERKSKRKPDEKYTYGYGRYSIVGGVITTLILLFGSAMVIYNAILRIINPAEIDYNGMIIFAIIGVIVNFCAAFFTREGESLNQRAVNLHMLEDVLGWVVVLIGAIIMRFTDLYIIDAIMSIGVAVFILINAIKNLKDGLNIFLEKVPSCVDINEIKEHICDIEGVSDVHHIHIWTIDGINNYATMHIVTSDNPHKVKEDVRSELTEHGIGHVTIEIENEGEHCENIKCEIKHTGSHGHHHHHHHHQ